MRVVVTGACGHFADVLLPQLTRHPSFDEIIGVDVRRPHYPVPGVKYHCLDVRDREMLHILDGADVLYHLAFVIFHRGKRRRAEEINIDASLQTFEMAGRRGIRRIVMASSHAVYGAHPDNPIPITEQWPLRGNRELHYAWAKRTIEEYIESFERRYPQVEVVRLRPCTVWGQHVPLSRTNLLMSSLSLASKTFDAPIQVLHEADLARAFVLGGTCEGLRGAYNLAPHDWIRPSDLRRVLRVRALEIPAPLLRFLNRAMWYAKITEVSPEWLVLAQHPIVLSNKKIADEIGWRPTHTTVSTAKQTVAMIRRQILGD